MIAGLLDRIRSLPVQGRRRLPNGTELIGHAPDVGPDAWVHIIFPPVTAELLAPVEEKLRREIPEPLRSLWSDCNGLSIFSDAVSIFGCRANWKRTGDAAWQPFDIVDPNTIERPKSLAPQLFAIGGRGSHGDIIYLNDETGRVVCYDQSGITLRADWPSLQEALVSEFNRLEPMV